MKIKITAKKWMGDDCYSWAVFRSDHPNEPCFSGLSKSEVPYYKKLVQEIIDRKESKNGRSNNV